MKDTLSLIAKGDEAASARKFKTSIKFYKQALQENSEDATTMAKIATQWEHVGDMMNAADWWENADDWRAKVDSDWLDERILERLGELACKRSDEARFICVSNDPGVLVLCLSAAQVPVFIERTLLDVDVLGQD